MEGTPHVGCPCVFVFILADGRIYPPVRANQLNVSGVQETLQQEAVVSGVVTGNNGEPLMGVTVMVKGTNRVATTDNNGRYSLKAPAGSTLMFSYIGYKKAEVKITGRNHNVTLEENNNLEEVVVVGYGTVRKADLAGSVSVMDNKSFKDQPITQVSDALQGRVSGVNVVSSGIPGGDVKIRIRGNNSISKSNDPLYVVDGMVRESGLEGINPEDIQSMQVLKDASSTAIYGSRGANGVVIVTTKSGRVGRTEIMFDASFGVSTAYHMPKVMGTKEYAQALVDYKGYSESELHDYLTGANPGIDWMDEILQTGKTQNYKLSISKGSEDLQFYLSTNYMKHEGVVVNSQYERYSAKLNVKSKLTRWLELTADASASHGVGKGGSFDMSQDNPIWIGLNYSPTMEMNDAQGNFNRDPYNSIQNNPYGMLTANRSERRRDVFNGRVDLKFNIVDGLTFTTTNGVDYYSNKGYSFATTKVQVQNAMGNNMTERMMLQSSNNLTYVHTWNEKHHLTATAVYEATKSSTRDMSITGRNLQAESVGWWDVNNAVNRESSNSYSDWSLLSGVARVMYNYDDRYMLTGTFRADGSSRFTNDKWGYFPSIAAAWTISNEKFMARIRDKVSNLKVRLSYGIIGNQDIDPYSTLGLMASTSFNFGTGTNYTGYWADSFATPDLTWEKTKQLDFGIDLGLFNNRLQFSFDYFNKKTSDALLQRTQAGYLGGTTYWVNAGEVSNKGFDISLTAHIIQNKNFNWTTTLTGTYLKNEVTKLTAEEPIIYGDSPSAGTVDPVTIIKEGEAIGTFYGYVWAGLNEDGVDSYYTRDGKITTTPEGEDRQVIGCANPDFTLGWNNTLSYKNWDFNVFFNAAFGAQRLNLVRFAMNSMVGASKFVTDADYFANMGVTMPRLDVDGNNNLGNSTKWLEDADYFRCENISIAYNLPKSVARVADFRFSFSIQNLFTITGYKGSDPAGFAFASNGKNVDRNSGIDMGSYPNPRTFTIGVRMNF